MTMPMIKQFLIDYDPIQDIPFLEIRNTDIIALWFHLIVYGKKGKIIDSFIDIKLNTTKLLLPHSSNGLTSV